MEDGVTGRMSFYYNNFSRCISARTGGLGVLWVGAHSGRHVAIAYVIMVGFLQELARGRELRAKVEMKIGLRGHK